MNEQYLFRGYDAKLKKMFPVHKIECSEITGSIIRFYGYVEEPGDTGGWKTAYGGDIGKKFGSSLRYSLMQCTGLRDSDGKLIFVGDIVQFTYWWFDGFGEADSYLTGEIIYDPDSLSYAMRGVKNADWIRHIGGEEGSSDTAAFATWRFEGDDFHIIGNIFENPKLMEDVK